MRGLSEFFTTRLTLFWSVMAAIIIGGVYSYMMMPKLEDPEIAVKQASVVVIYPGATVHQVELEAVTVMEDALRTLPHVKEVRSEVQEGMGLLTVELEMSTPEGDVQQIWDMLRRKVSDCKMMLPSDCMEPMVMDDISDVYGIFLDVRAKGYEISDVERYVRMMKRELLNVQGVRKVSIFGTREECVSIELNKEQMSRNGIVPTQIMMALNNAGKVAGSGSYQVDGEDIPIRVSSEFYSIEDIKNLRIKTYTGEQMSLGDVAKITLEYKEPQTGGFWVDGEEAVALFVSLESDVNVADMGKVVDKKLEELKGKLPVGFEIGKVFYQPDKVTAAIDSFLWNLVESVLIVVIVLIFAMGLKSSLIIGAGLVLTIAMSMPILLGLGTTLQRISLGAFIVAMGMLVDNSIVIIDGILVDKAKGLNPKQYLFNICEKTAMPLLGATIIAASSFLAVYIADGTASEYASDLFIVLGVSLLCSWLLALTQVPVFSMYFLGGKKGKEYSEDSNGDMNTAYHKLIRKALKFFIKHKIIVAVCAVGALALSGLGMLKTRILMFPDFNYNQFIIEYQLPSGTDANVVKRDLLDITKMLKEEFPDVKKITASQGSTPARYCLVRPMNNGGNSYGELLVDFKDFDKCSENIPNIRKRLREAYPDAMIRTRRYNFSIATSHVVEARFIGPDPAVLRKLAEEAEEIMRNEEAIDPYSVQNNWREKKKVLVADYIQPVGVGVGIDKTDVCNSLAAAGDGYPCGIMKHDDKKWIMYLKVREGDGSRIKDLNDIPVWTQMPNINVSDGDMKDMMTGAKSAEEIQSGMFASSTMSNVARELRFGFEESMITRKNGQRAIEAECDVRADQGETPMSGYLAVKEKIENIKLPDGYSFEWTGEIAMQDESIGGVLRYVPISLLIFVVVLLLLFNSWKKVILILMVIPFIIVGVAPGMLVFDQPMTFMVIIAFCGLMGMMIKNAVVLVDEITNLYKEGYTPYDAVIQAGVSRARPVIMASMTTILGMIPLLGDPMYGAMAVAIMAGLGGGTVFTLGVLPVLYAVLYKIKEPKD